MRSHRFIMSVKHRECYDQNTGACQKARICGLRTQLLCQLQLRDTGADVVEAREPAATAVQAAEAAACCAKQRAVTRQSTTMLSRTQHTTSVKVAVCGSLLYGHVHQCHNDMQHPGPEYIVPAAACQAT